MFAGPNGSGKTTLSRYYRESDALTIDPDRVAADYALSEISAGRAVLGEIKKRLKDGSSFAIETTLAGKSMLATIRDAYQRGYIVELYFVATVDPAINIERIAARVARGGHHIPDDVVRRRYPRSIEHAAKIAAFADFVGIVDNSGMEPATCIRLDNGEIAITCVPDWATRIARVLEERVMRERDRGRLP